MARRNRNRDEHEQVGNQRDERRKFEDATIDTRGDDGFLLRELDAISDKLRPAMKTAGVHRPEPRLHVRHRLVLHLTDQQRHGQEDNEAAEQLADDFQRRHSGSPASLSAAAATSFRARSGPHSSGDGTPGGSIRRRPGDPCVSRSDSPGSLAPGHIFATREARMKSLRSG